jgi:transposase
VAAFHRWRLERCQVRGNALIPPAYVKPYVKRGKNDAHDAQAICDTASRPDMRFVPAKIEDQQATLMLHTTRQVMVGRRTALINSLRGQLVEFGMITEKGLSHARQLINIVTSGTDDQLCKFSSTVLEVLTLITDQVQETEKAIAVLDQKIKDWHAQSPCAQVLTSVPVPLRSKAGQMPESTQLSTATGLALHRPILMLMPLEMEGSSRRSLSLHRCPCA